jgi:hypothetical protein
MFNRTRIAITGERSVAEQHAQETAEMVQETKAMIGDVSKVLQTRRWETRTEPFTSFNSPEGRF